MRANQRTISTTHLKSSALDAEGRGEQSFATKLKNRQNCSTKFRVTIATKVSINNTKLSVLFRKTIINK